MTLDRKNYNKTMEALQNIMLEDVKDANIPDEDRAKMASSVLVGGDGADEIDRLRGEIEGLREEIKELKDRAADWVWDGKVWRLE